MLFNAILLLPSLLRPGRRQTHNEKGRCPGYSPASSSDHRSCALLGSHCSIEFLDKLIGDVHRFTVKDDAALGVENKGVAILFTKTLHHTFKCLEDGRQFFVL